MKLIIYKEIGEKKKMKKICILMAALMLSMVLPACKHDETMGQHEPSKSAGTPPNDSRFIVVEEKTIFYYVILADKETGVMYAVSRGGYNAGNFTLLVDPDGKPLIWEGGER